MKSIVPEKVFTESQKLVKNPIFLREKVNNN